MEKRLFLGLLFLSATGFFGLVKGGEQSTETVMALPVVIQNTLERTQEEKDYLISLKNHCLGGQEVARSLDCPLALFDNRCTEERIDFYANVLQSVENEVVNDESMEGRRHTAQHCLDLVTKLSQKSDEMERAAACQRFQEGVRVLDETLTKKINNLTEDQKIKNEELALLSKCVLANNDILSELQSSKSDSGFKLTMRKNNFGLYNLVKARLKVHNSPSFRLTLVSESNEK